MKNVKCYDLLLEPTDNSFANRRIKNSFNAVCLANEVFKLNKSNREQMIVIGLDSRCYITGIHQVSAGLIDSTATNPDQLFKFLLLTNSTMFLILHNHPSGSCKASKADEGATARLLRCARLMNIQMLDHIIIARDEYSSMKEDTAVFELS